MWKGGHNNEVKRLRNERKGKIERKNEEKERERIERRRILIGFPHSLSFSSRLGPSRRASLERAHSPDLSSWPR